MELIQKIPRPRWAELYVSLFNKLHNTKIEARMSSSADEVEVLFKFDDTRYLLYFFFAYQWASIQMKGDKQPSFELAQDSYLMRVGRKTDIHGSKLTKPVFAEIAVVHKFNQTHGTVVAVSDYILDGCPFVTFDFKNTSKEMLFLLGYQVGLTQEELSSSKEYVDMLPLKDYPLLPEWGETGYESDPSLGENYCL
jgi:hypothetical protein